MNRHAHSTPGREEIFMKETEHDVEMRFLVPSHLATAARQAMSALTVKEITPYVNCPAPERKTNPSRLTNQELDLLLSE